MFGRMSLLSDLSSIKMSVILDSMIFKRVVMMLTDYTDVMIGI